MLKMRLNASTVSVNSSVHFPDVVAVKMPRIKGYCLERITLVRPRTGHEVVVHDVCVKESIDEAHVGCLAEKFLHFIQGVPPDCLVLGL
jgi:hypothetical protein